MLIVSLFIVIARAEAVSDTYESIVFHPFTMDWDNADCIPMDEDGDGIDDVRNCDPVNLVFPDLTVSQVIAALELQGWETTIFGGVQSLHFETNELLDQSEQLIKIVGTTRYHVRLWQVPDQAATVGAVHGETIIIHDLNTHWEDAEAFLAGDLCTSNFFCENSDLLVVQWDVQGLDAEWRGWTSNGRLTVIRASSPAAVYLPIVSTSSAD